jgi:hypothetical protein
MATIPIELYLTIQKYPIKISLPVFLMFIE